MRFLFPTLLLNTLFLVCSSKATATVFYVVPGNSLQESINLADSGDTLFISGNYKIKDLKIEKPLVLKGIDHPVLDGGNEANVLIIKAKHVLIDGLNIYNSGTSGYNDYAGIKIENSEDVKIINCIIKNCFFGIYFAGTITGEIANNTIISNKPGETSSGNGIHLWKCEQISIHNNDVRAHRDGIYLEFTTNSLIKSNFSADNIRYGLHFMFSHNNEYIGNTFENNGAGVAVMYTKYVKMISNKFIENKGTSSYGLLLKDISDSKIYGNIFENNTCAINMEECNRISVHNNNFRANGWAIRIQASCSGNVIENNNFIGNTFDIATNGTMVMNTFDGNYWDKYTGYDLNKDKTGDIPHAPVSIYAIIVDQLPVAMILYRSFMVTLLEQMEKIIPSITPAELVDNKPKMKPVKL